MTDTLHLSRIRLRKGQAERLGPILLPEGSDARPGVTHRLVWSLFSEDLKERPFLYRDSGPSGAPGRAGRGDIFILSKSPPEDRLQLFDLDTKPFEPALAPGDRLHFVLRANPTVNRRGPDGKTRRFDVVMDALHAVPKGARAAERPKLIRAAGLKWFSGQAETAGFRLTDPEDRLAIEGYDQVAIARDPGGRIDGKALRHTGLDFEGELQVLDPALFVRRLAEGFGRARAFGYGLMLIRRVLLA